MNKTNTPFRYDYVGSFLRPAALKQARADFQSGRIDAAALKAVEDDAIRDLVAKQKAAGYHVITDGEFRRATWHLDFMWGFHGVGHTPTKTGLPFQGEAAMLDDTYLTGKVSVDEHPFVEHFRFVKALEDENTVAKLTIPAPAQFLEQMVMPFAMENTKRFYPSVQELMDDLAAGYRKVIADVYAAGCRNLQFDDCSWGMLVDPRACMIFDTDAKGLEEIKEQMLTVNNMAIGGKPDDLVINTHVCRGNFHSTYASSGAYDSVAKTLLARENVNAYYLEFDDARSGNYFALGVKLVDFDTLLAESDVLSLHMNLTEENYHMFNKEAFMKCKKHPIIVNEGRGPLICDEDLVWALDNGYIRGAALDMVESEDPDLNPCPLVGRDDVLLTPHSGYYSDTSNYLVAKLSMDNALYYVAGEYDKVKSIRNGVNA